MWCLFGRGEAPSIDVLSRLDALEDEQQRYERRWQKLQGEFNASVRRQAQLERENDELNEELETLSEGRE